jgi:hypothetical protein
VILSKKYFPLWSRFVLFNLMAILLLAFKGQFRCDRASVFGIIFAFALMNLVAWVGSRNFRNWK